MHRQLVLASSLALLVTGQQRGTLTTETHPTLPIQHCTKSGGCVSQSTKVVLDANWRWLHNAATGQYSNCFSSNTWNSTLCPDPVTCASNCAYDGATYSDYGITTSGGNITQLLFPSTGSYGTRIYLLADDNHYAVFKMLNQEISFDVDVSGLPCGANGALYMTNMAADGGSGSYPANKAGAYMGTGYCDAQCARSPQFINGQANLINWDSNAGTGMYGNCCHEMDIWESNGAATALTAHTCSALGPTRCSSSTSDCGASGICDQSGCDFNPYRLGNTTFYGGTGATVSTLPGYMRVITQFITNDGTATGNLTEVRRAYIRGGKTISNSVSKVSGASGYSSLSDNYCAAEASAFSATNTFASHGGMSSMTTAMNAGMVLTLSVWIDWAYDMRWLDSAYPSGASTSSPGVVRGPCATSAGDPNTLKSQYPNAQVKFANIKYGDIGTTFGSPYP